MAGVVGAAVMGVTARAALMVTAGTAVMHASRATMMAVAACAGFSSVNHRSRVTNADALGLIRGALRGLVGVGRLVAIVEGPRIARVLGVTSVDDRLAVGGN